VLLFSGGPIFESSIPLSVFGIDRQDAGVPRYRLLVCAGEQGPLATTGGLSMTAPYGLDALSRAGTIVVPAWRSPGQNPPASALDALRRAHAEGARIIGLCTGAFVLAAAGLLDGRPATTHWMFAPTLAKRFPRVLVDPRELYIDDGDVLTSAGTAAGIDLCLHVVRTDHGTEAANALARRLVVPARRAGGQAQYIDRSLPEEIGSDPLAEVVTWALDNLSQHFDVEALAARAYMSRRTFDRRFRTLTGSAPLQWLISQRVLQAQRLLETTDLSVDEVARHCGFRSPVALRGHFRRQLGVSPAVYRTNFRSRHPLSPSGGSGGSGGAPGTAVPAQGGGAAAAGAGGGTPGSAGAGVPNQAGAAGATGATPGGASGGAFGGAFGAGGKTSVPAGSSAGSRVPRPAGAPPRGGAPGGTGGGAAGGAGGSSSGRQRTPSTPAAVLTGRQRADLRVGPGPQSSSPDGGEPGRGQGREPGRGQGSEPTGGSGRAPGRAATAATATATATTAPAAAAAGERVPAQGREPGDGASPGEPHPAVTPACPDHAAAEDGRAAPAADLSPQAKQHPDAPPEPVLEPGREPEREAGRESGA